MDVRFCLKLGPTSIEFEGSNEVFADRISPLIDRLLDGAAEAASPGLQELRGADTEARTTSGTIIIPQMTAKTVAMKLGADSGSSLLYAAVASLAVVKSRDTFSRSDLNNEMRAAIGFYKPSYSSNLSNYIDTLLKQGVIIEVSKDTFALREAERAAMKQKLSQ